MFFINTIRRYRQQRLAEAQAFLKKFKLLKAQLLAKHHLLLVGRVDSRLLSHPVLQCRELESPSLVDETQAAGPNTTAGSGTAPLSPRSGSLSATTMHHGTVASSCASSVYDEQALDGIPSLVSSVSTATTAFERPLTPDIVRSVRRKLILGSPLNDDDIKLAYGDEHADTPINLESLWFQSLKNPLTSEEPHHASAYSDTLSEPSYLQAAGSYRDRNQALGLSRAPDNCGASPADTVVEDARKTHLSYSRANTNNLPEALHAPGDQTEPDAGFTSDGLYSAHTEPHTSVGHIDAIIRSRLEDLTFSCHFVPMPLKRNDESRQDYINGLDTALTRYLNDYKFVVESSNLIRHSILKGLETFKCMETQNPNCAHTFHKFGEKVSQKQNFELNMFSDLSKIHFDLRAAYEVGGPNLTARQQRQIVNCLTKCFKKNGDVNMNARIELLADFREYNELLSDPITVLKGQYPGSQLATAII